MHPINKFLQFSAATVDALWVTRLNYLSDEFQLIYRPSQSRV